LSINRFVFKKKERFLRYCTKCHIFKKKYLNLAAHYETHKNGGLIGVWGRGRVGSRLEKGGQRTSVTWKEIKVKTVQQQKTKQTPVGEINYFCVLLIFFFLYTPSLLQVQLKKHRFVYLL